MSKEQSNFYLGENVSNTAKRPFAAVATSVRRVSSRVLAELGELLGERHEARFFGGINGVRADIIYFGLSGVSGPAAAPARATHVVGYEVVVVPDTAMI